MLEVKITSCTAVTMQYYTWRERQLNPDSVARNDRVEIGSQAHSLLNQPGLLSIPCGRLYQP